MIKFTAVITDHNGVSGAYTGEMIKGQVNSTELAWEAGSGYESGPTKSYSLEIEGGEKFELPGEAYRNLDQHGLIPKFELLATLNSDLARKLAEIVEEGDTVFSSLVTTSDATQSCTVYSASDDDHGAILSEAREKGEWELNDGNSIDEVYFGGGSDEDIEEIELEAFLDILIRRAVLQLQEKAKEGAFSLASHIAQLTKWGEVVNGKPFQPSDGQDDSHLTLMRLIDQARQLFDLIS